MRVVFSPWVRMLCLCVLAIGLVSGSAGGRAPRELTNLSMRGSDVAWQPALNMAMPAAPSHFRLASTAAYERAASELEVLAEVEQHLPFEVPANSQLIQRVCRVTAYCDRGITASGIPSGVGQCAAPGDIPLGSTVYIPDLDRTFVVTDRTHRRFRRSTVDIFIPTKKDCRQFGRRFLECEFTVPVD